MSNLKLIFGLFLVFSLVFSGCVAQVEETTQTQDVEDKKEDVAEQTTEETQDKEDEETKEEMEETSDESHGEGDEPETIIVEQPGTNEDEYTGFVPNDVIEEVYIVDPNTQEEPEELQLNKAYWIIFENDIPMFSVEYYLLMDGQYEIVETVDSECPSCYNSTKHQMQLTITSDLFSTLKVVAESSRGEVGESKTYDIAN